MAHSTETYKLFADYYDLYVGKFSADLEFYHSFCKKPEDIVEIGCGTGRILAYFLERGFKITGTDISVEMLEKAHEKLNAYEKSGFLKLSIDNLANKPLEQKFDKVFITFYTFNYIIEKPEGFLKNVYKSMNDGGLLLIDLFYPKSFVDKSAGNHWSEQIISIGGKQIQIKDNRKVLNDIEYRTQIYCEDGNEITIKTERKYYSPDRINELLKLAGFKEIVFSLSYNKEHFSSAIDQYRLKTNFIIGAKK
jgi:SAM-dependent methyltransferase